jgi:hypothetical protein
MYKVPISVLEDCSKNLKELTKFIKYNHELGNIDLSKHILKYINKSEKLIELIELNYGIK